MKLYQWMSAVWIVVAIAATVYSGEVKQIDLIREGKPQAVIVIAKDSSKIVQAAADLLAEYIFKSTSVRLAILTESVTDENVLAIHCGLTDYVKSLNLNTDAMNQDAFKILFPSDNNIVIVGGSDYGTEFGVCDFLERYLGIRWLFPGELGEHVPRHDAVSIPVQDVYQMPAFLSRTLSGLEGNQYEWTYRNKMRGYRSRKQGRFLEHGHYLGVLLHPGKYGKTHLQYYPEINGQRRVPKGVVGWQPCFTAEGIVEEYVRNIKQHFLSRPEAKSISLGANDTGGYCEGEKCRAVNGGRMNSLEMTDSSLSYYQFCNAVVEGVLQTYPDKFFGLLAYSNVIDPPFDLKLNDRIIPFLTFDRFKWVDADIEQKGKALTHAWSKAASTLGYYDYQWGKYYSIPRVYFHHMADYIRFGYENNVRHFYAEARPNEKGWPEGPKFYLTLKLLWDPYLDVDKTLEQWYVDAVGTEAAPYLAQYFSFWEQLWTQRIARSDWFKDNHSRQYLSYIDLRYMDVVTNDDLAQCRKWMNQTVGAAATMTQRRRAKLFRNDFKAMEATIGSRLEFSRMNRKPLPNKTGKKIAAFGFDTQKQAWESWQNTYSRSRLDWDASTGHKKIGSLRINRDGDKNAKVISGVTFMRPFKVNRGDIYHLSVWCKTEGVKPNAKVGFTLRWQDKQEKWVQFMSLARVKNIDLISDGQWQKLDVYVRVPVHTKRSIEFLRCHLMVDDTDRGQIWFDDFSISKISR